MTPAEIQRTIKRIEKRAQSKKKEGTVPVKRHGGLEESSKSKAIPGDKTRVKSGDIAGTIVSPLRSFSFATASNSIRTSESEGESSSDSTLSGDLNPEDVSTVIHVVFHMSILRPSSALHFPPKQRQKRKASSLAHSSAFVLL
jgi:hypothetical protein